MQKVKREKVSRTGMIETSAIKRIFAEVHIQPDKQLFNKF